MLITFYCNNEMQQYINNIKDHHVNGERHERIFNGINIKGSQYANKCVCIIYFVSWTTSSVVVRIIGFKLKQYYGENRLIYG